MTHITYLPFFSVIFLVIQVTTHIRVETLGHKNYSQTPPLVDVVHTYLPDMSRYEKWIDILVLLPVLAIVAMECYGHGVDYESLVWCLMVVYCLRALFNIVTILPCPRALHRFKSFGGKYTCIFSGHTAFLVVLSYFIFKRLPELKYHLMTFCLLGSLFIVMSRTHYTVDVLVAWLVVYVVLITQALISDCGPDMSSYMKTFHTPTMR